MQEIRGWIGFDSGVEVEPGAQLAVVTRPQMLFKGERLYVPKACASAFTLEALRVGLEPQGWCAFPPVPAEAFAECRDGELFALLDAAASAGRPTGEVSDLLEHAHRTGGAGEPVGMATAQPAVDVRLDVVNIGAEPARFRAVIFGRAL